MMEGSRAGAAAANRAAPSDRSRRLLALATHPARAAATRYRVALHANAFRERGIDLELIPFLDDDYFRRQSSSGRRIGKALDLLRFAARRASLSLGPLPYDALFVQREAALVGPEIVEWLLHRWRKLPLVFDFDDAIWMHPPVVGGGVPAGNPFAARLLKAPSKTRRIIAMSNAVIAGSEYLAAYARKFSANVYVVPTVVSRDRFTPSPARALGSFVGDVPVVGWIGSPTTVYYLKPLLAELAELAQSGARFKLRIIGADHKIEVPGVEIDQPPWSLEREVEQFQSLDVGLAPSGTDAWAEGKCSFKQLQYMAAGVPVVTTLSGSARDFVRDGQNALVADSPREWARAVKRLLDDGELRARLASAARRLVEDEYCAELQSPRVARIVSEVIESRASASTQRAARATR